jgi:hypothetical protein
MRTLPSGIRGTAQSGEHVARPVYSLYGTNLRTSTESACRTCGGPIRKTNKHDGLRGTWRHTGVVPTPVAPVDHTEAIHAARERNLRMMAVIEASKNGRATSAEDVAWQRNNPGYVSPVHQPRRNGAKK